MTGDARPRSLRTNSGVEQLLSSKRNCFPQNSTAELGRPETVVGGLPRCCVGSALEVSVRPEAAITRALASGHPGEPVCYPPTCCMDRRTPLRSAASFLVVFFALHVVLINSHLQKMLSGIRMYCGKTVARKEISKPELSWRSDCRRTFLPTQSALPFTSHMTRSAICAASRSI